MMGKKSKKANKSFAEEEMEAYATAAPDIHEDPVKTILGIIDTHAKELRRLCLKYASIQDLGLYSGYVEAAAAFDNLQDDLKREGFAL